VEDETARRIEREHDGGQALDSGIQKQMGASMGFDFDQVKVHASPEADALNQELGAEAFTTGNDIYFREGAMIRSSKGAKAAGSRDDTCGSAEQRRGGEMAERR
jgi:hypothetical protein